MTKPNNPFNQTWFIDRYLKKKSNMMEGEGKSKLAVEDDREQSSNQLQSRILLKRKYKSNEMIVNNKSSFKSFLVKCQAIMNNINFDELVIKAMGRAIPRALSVAKQLNSNNFNTFSISERTYSVNMIDCRFKRPLRGANKDSFDPDAIDIADGNLKCRATPVIEIIVRKNKFEIERLKHSRRKI